MPVKQQKELSSSVKVKYLNGPQIIKELKSISKDIAKRNNNILGIYLFGSLSKKRYAPGSDADILIILKEDTRRIIDRTSEYIKYFSDISIAVDIFPYTKTEFNRMMLNGNSFIKHIWKQKINLLENESRL